MMYNADVRTPRTTAPNTRNGSTPFASFGFGSDVLFDPEGTPGASGTSTNGANDPAAVPGTVTPNPNAADPGGTVPTGTVTPPPTPENPNSRASNVDRALRTDERAKLNAKLEAAGATIVRDANGRVDYAATLQAYGERFAETKVQTVQQSQSLQEEQLKQQLAAIQAETAAAQQRAAQAEREKTEFILRARIQSGFANRVFDGALDDATLAFLANHTIVTDEDGHESVKDRSGAFVLNDQNQIATLAEAQQKFLVARPYYLPATARPQPNNGAGAAGQTVIAAQGVISGNLQDIASGKTVVR